MCGGRGTRLSLDREKPLVEIDGRPMVDRVTDALAASSIAQAYAVTSPKAPATREHVALPPIDAPGEGYVADLQYTLERVELPVLTVAADLPLLDGDAVDSILDSFEGDSMTVCVRAERKRRLGISVETTIPADGPELAPTGVNVIAENDSERQVVLADPRLAVNVNHARDARVAEALLRSGVIP